MAATKLNLTVEQGATFSQTIAVGTDYNGYAARAKLRRADFYGSPTEFTCSAVSGGNCTLSLTAAQTAALPRPTWAKPDERSLTYGPWDLELVSGDTVVRSREGVVTLSHEASYD